MAFHGPTYGLDAELQSKRLQSYDMNLEREARDWIQAVTGTAVGSGDQLAQDLKDGVILCNLINCLRANTIRSINKGKMPFMQMENIGKYLEACRGFGVIASDMFQTVDLYEAKNMNQVINNIHALGRVAPRIGYRGATIGVKLSDRHETNFSTQQLRQGEGTLGLLQEGQRKAGSNQVNRAHDVNKNYQQKW
eukprot:TRINITY_DN273_c2_g2_i3.p1 TRINITY_DN273_c2_g2~~TRINITY_DN273_c2_g2_i3.p1  ORF type:complete len:193 (+),score=102.03 TRINITY_DN273_c2_g2_i3:151-729(+)